jgi:hypothetical protein
LSFCVYLTVTSFAVAASDAGASAHFLFPTSFMKKITLISILLASSTSLAFAQATNNCNLLPNPSFEQQNVLQLSGNPNNIAGMYSQYNEVASWQCFGNYYGPSSPTYGRPTYYATNAPVGSATNPFTNPATNVNGSPFLPYNYNQSLNNGALSIIAAEIGTSSPINQPQYVTATVLQALTPGATYYASFQAYRSSAPGGAVRLGMNLSQDGPAQAATTTSTQTSAPVTNSAWTKVSGKISIPNPLPNGHSSSDPWTVTIGNISPNGPGARARYYIDEVELYKIPTAGVSPAAVCFNANTSFTLGEGCLIPNASYTWSAPGVVGLPSNSSTIQITVSPTTTTVYTLTVNLPDGTTSTSKATVTIIPHVDDPQAMTPEWDCVDGPGPIWAYIYNYDPTLTYTITTTNNIRNVPANAFSQQYDKNGVLRWAYSLRSVYPGRTGLVTVTASNACGRGVTTYNITSPGAECDTGPSEYAVGYPNPATDKLQAPAGAKQPVLLDSRGNPVQRADASGKFDVQSLPDGLYNLQVMKNGKLINQRIQVKH